MLKIRYKAPLKYYYNGKYGSPKVRLGRCKLAKALIEAQEVYGSLTITNRTHRSLYLNLVNSP